LGEFIVKLRQLAIAARSLEPVRSQLFTLFGLENGFQDPGVNEFGLENSVMTLGDTFFEVVAPIIPETAVHRALDKSGHESTGYMALLQVDDFATFDAHAKALQLRQVWSTNRDDVSACHIHPKDMPGAIVSFDQMRPAKDWVWAGPNWQDRGARDIRSIEGMELHAAQPQAVAERWAEITQRELTQTGSGFRLILDADTWIDFTRGPSLRIASFSIATTDRELVRKRAKAAGLLSDDSVHLGDLQLHLT